MESHVCVVILTSKFGIVNVHDYVLSCCLSKILYTPSKILYTRPSLLNQLNSFPIYLNSSHISNIDFTNILSCVWEICG